jgi:hypothetical protein
MNFTTFGDPKTPFTISQTTYFKSELFVFKDLFIL